MRGHLQRIYIFSMAILGLGLFCASAHAKANKSEPHLNGRLIEAINRSDAHSVHGLLQLGADPNSSDKYGMHAFTISLYDGAVGTQLFQFPFRSHSFDMAKQLLAAGADINGTDPSGRTALMRMSELGAPDVVAFLLKMGASTDKRDNSGNSALHWAARNYVFYLPENKDQREKRVKAASSVIHSLVSHGLNLNGTDKYGVTPLMDACLISNSAIASYLLTLGADVSMTSVTGETALTMAIRSTNESTVQILLSHGADPNQVAKPGWPPLFWAVSMHQLNLVKLLLKFGADPHRKFVTKDKEMSAEDLATQLGLTDMVKALQISVIAPKAK